MSLCISQTGTQAAASHVMHNPSRQQRMTDMWGATSNLGKNAETHLVTSPLLLPGEESGVPSTSYHRRSCDHSKVRPRNQIVRNERRATQGSQSARQDGRWRLAPRDVALAGCASRAASLAEACSRIPEARRLLHHATPCIELFTPALLDHASCL